MTEHSFAPGPKGEFTTTAENLVMDRFPVEDPPGIALIEGAEQIPVEVEAIVAPLDAARHEFVGCFQCSLNTG
jgi:hypothetical protein